MIFLTDFLKKDELHRKQTIGTESAAQILSNQEKNIRNVFHDIRTHHKHSSNAFADLNTLVFALISIILTHVIFRFY